MISDNVLRLKLETARKRLETARKSGASRKEIQELEAEAQRLWIMLAGL